MTTKLSYPTNYTAFWWFDIIDYTRAPIFVLHITLNFWKVLHNSDTLNMLYTTTVFWTVTTLNHGTTALFTVASLRDAQLEQSMLFKTYFELWALGTFWNHTPDSPTFLFTYKGLLSPTTRVLEMPSHFAGLSWGRFDQVLLATTKNFENGRNCGGIQPV